MDGDQSTSRHAGTAPRPNTGGCGNRLLDAIPADRFALLEPHLERITLAPGRTLFEPGDDVTHAYFPCGGAAIALVTVMADGRTAEAAVVGCEGAVGVIISAGDKPASTRAMVQMPGHALRLEAARLEQAKHASAAIRDTVSRYSDALLAQVLQSVACNALHPVEERICRWLLSLQDRAGTLELPVTQEQLADQLGVRRTTVTRVMARLEAAGMIRGSRGKVAVVNRPRLRHAACECYQTVREHFYRVAPGLYPVGPKDL